MENKVVTLKNGKNFSFECSSRKNRSGFVHECRMFGGKSVQSYKAQYYNRTWESYCYESVIRACVSMEINDVKESIKNEILENHNRSRLGKSLMGEYESALQNNDYLKDLSELKEKVMDYKYMSGWY